MTFTTVEGRTVSTSAPTQLLRERLPGQNLRHLIQVLPAGIEPPAEYEITEREFLRLAEARLL